MLFAVDVPIVSCIANGLRYILEYSSRKVSPLESSLFASLGICRFRVNPNSSGLWTVHQEYFDGGKCKSHPSFHFFFVVLPDCLSCQVSQI